MNRKRYSITQLVRHCVQLAAFVLFPGLFISIFSALKDLVLALIEGNFSLSAMGSQLILLLAVFPITILWGRFFCGYLCSFGAMGDLIYSISHKLFPKLPKVSLATNRYLSCIKYMILAYILVAVWILGLGNGTSFSPWNVFGQLTALNITNIATPGLILLLAIMLGSVFIERFFCRYFCPLGAAFAVTSRGRFFKIRRKTNTCVNCTLCDKECSMGLPISSKDIVKSGDCIDCMKCSNACPTDALHTNPDPAVSGTAAALMTIGMVSLGNIAIDKGLFTSTAAAQTTTFSDTQQAANRGTYRDGTYTGSASGYRGTTEVSVTVSKGNITEIDVTSYQDDQEFFNKAKTSVIDSIISTQSVDVSTVSGATYSSQGLIQAVADALNVSAEETNDSSTDAQNSAIDLSSIADGTYEGRGTGFRGDTKVSLTVSKHQIIDITITSYADDQKFFERAESSMIDAILAKQSLNVSTVSGATFSSNSILEAVANALGTEWTNPNSSLSRGHGSGHGGPHGSGDHRAS